MIKNYINNVDWEQVVRLTQKLITINSFEEKGKKDIFKYLYSYLSGNPRIVVELFDMDTDAPYLIASLKSNSEPNFKLLLQGHIDTVDPDSMENALEPVINNGFMWGRGSIDMKSGCAAILAAFMECAKIEGLKGDIHLALSSDEEYNAAEMVKALKLGHLPVCDLGIIAEPTGTCLAVAHKGNAWARVNFTGKSAHASIPQSGINSIYMASQFVNELTQYIEKAYKNTVDELLDRPTMVVGTIVGGSGTNVVPESCSITIDKRYLPDDNIDTFKEELSMLLEKCRSKYTNFNGSYSIIVDCPGLKFPVESDIYGAIIKAIEKTTSSPVKSIAFPGWGEGGYIQQFNIPTLYYGPGDMSKAHTSGECVEVEDIISVSKGVMSIILDTCF